jgi:hypothetical protein
VIPRVISRKQQPTYGKLPKRFPSTNFGTYTQRGLTKHLTAPSAPTAPAAPTPFTPTASGASGIGSTAPAAQADPRDAQYFNDTAKLDQYYASRSADITAQQNEADRVLASNQSLLTQQQPKDTLAAKVNANKAGLFYSGELGKNLSSIEADYTRRRTDLQGAYASDKATRSRSRADLEANYGVNGLNRNDILLAANARQSERDQTLGVPDAAAAAPAPAAGPAAAPFTAFPGVSKSGERGVWHVYPGGRKVFVKK